MTDLNPAASDPEWPTWDEYGSLIVRDPNPMAREMADEITAIDPEDVQRWITGDIELEEGLFPPWFAYRVRCVQEIVVKMAERVEKGSFSSGYEDLPGYRGVENWYLIQVDPNILAENDREVEKAGLNVHEKGREYMNVAALHFPLVQRLRSQVYNPSLTDRILNSDEQVMFERLLSLPTHEELVSSLQGMEGYIRQRMMAAMKAVNVRVSALSETLKPDERNALKCVVQANAGHKQAMARVSYLRNSGWVLEALLAVTPHARAWQEAFVGRLRDGMFSRGAAFDILISNSSLTVPRLEKTCSWYSDRDDVEKAVAYRAISHSYSDHALQAQIADRNFSRIPTIRVPSLVAGTQKIYLGTSGNTATEVQELTEMIVSLLKNLAKSPPFYRKYLEGGFSLEGIPLSATEVIALQLKDFSDKLIECGKYSGRV
jgi:hypothetical protein